MAHETSTVAQAEAATTSPRTAPRSAWRPAALFAVAYLLLGLAWLGSNPPGAAPDEQDHLTKALGVARLDIGEEYAGPPQADNPIGVRNASISRVVEIPSELDPEGYRCMARQAEEPAACQPTSPPPAGGTVDRVTPVGAYPPFVYLPAGLAASTASTPVGAFLGARLAFLLLNTAFLLVGAHHLVRWLGPPSLLGAFVGLTPMAVFSASAVGTSGLEIASAFAVAAAAVVAVRRPESLTTTSTQLLLAVAGATLVLSRQLGAVTLAVLLLAVAVRVGWRRLWALLREHRPVFVGSLVALVVAGVAVVVWELRYDHPSNTGTPFSWAALRDFDVRLLTAIRSGIGVFGWLDSPMPQVAMALWVIALAVVCGTGLLLADRADRWTLVAVVAVMAVVAYVVYAIVFFTIGASLQGRHILPLFIVVPLLAGLVVVEKLTAAGLGAAVSRLFVVTGVLVGGLQLVSLYFNARRYAVGTDGPVLFLGRSQWRPEWGWQVWLLTGAVGALLLGVAAVRSRHGLYPRPVAPEVVDRVER